MKSSRRVQVNNFLESISGLGIKLGGPVALLGLAYLVYLIVGGRLLGMKGMKPVDQQYLIQTVAWAGTMLKIGSVACVLGLAIRFFYMESVGQVLALLGGGLYFFGPAGMNRLTMGALTGVPLYVEIVNEIAFVGLACLPAGAILLIRAMIERIQRCLARRIVAARQWGDEEEQLKIHKRKRQIKPRFCEKCWEMAFCREFVRNVCPAWDKKKPCWRVKSGCYCDEATILRAMTAGSVDNIYARGIVQSLAGDKAKPKPSAKQKRARCRRCMIYAEHQRQKYRVMNPVAFAAVALLFIAFYKPLSAIVWVALEKTDRFMSFLAYNTTAQHTLGSSGLIMTNLAILWLAMMVLTYTLKALEYLIFDLQV